MSDTEIHKSQTLEHLGLVAGMFDELLGIGELLVDEPVPQDLSQRKVSVGQALQANLVLNGLGFPNRRLYLMPEFFCNKPTERLVGAGVSSEHLNDDALGKALDTLITPSGSPNSTRRLDRVPPRRAAARVPPRQVRGEARYSPDGRGLKAELFLMDCQSTSVEEDDSPYREMGCYLVPAINLVVGCLHGCSV
jgi:hypothetical protein